MSRRNPRSRPAPPLFPEDRATAPQAVEETSLSAWQRFQALQNGEAPAPGPAGPAATPAPSAPPAGYEKTEPMVLSRRDGQARPSPGGPVSLEDVMVLARRNNRACPQPQRWAEFHKLLPVQAMHRRVLVAPPPLEGAAWTAASDMQKRLRLREQIEWADRTSALPQAHAFLAALREEDWHHFGA